MFKSVTYEGFESVPELRVKCEAVTNRLSLRRSLPIERLGLHWVLRPAETLPQTENTIELELTDERIGSERVSLNSDQVKDVSDAIAAIMLRRRKMTGRFVHRMLKGLRTDMMAEAI
jgi:hypothetical protein